MPNFKPLLPLPSPSPKPAAKPAIFQCVDVPVTPTPAAASDEKPVPHVHAEPTVTYQRDGDKITRITVTCRCGEVIELACAY